MEGKEEPTACDGRQKANFNNRSAQCSARAFKSQQTDDARPSPKAVAAARDLVFAAIVEHSALAESYARSASEAAWRGDEVTLGVHLRQLRLCVIASIQTFKSLDGGGAI